jgi:hypothetical protein
MLMREMVTMIGRGRGAATEVGSRGHGWARMLEPHEQAWLPVQPTSRGISYSQLSGLTGFSYTTENNMAASWEKGGVARFMKQLR